MERVPSDVGSEGEEGEERRLHTDYSYTLQIFEKSHKPINFQILGTSLRFCGSIAFVFPISHQFCRA